MERVGKCSKCGDEAAWNTPCINRDAELFCDTCSNDSPEILHGVAQHLDENGRYQVEQFGVVRYKDIILWTKDHITCWWSNGRRSYPLNDTEKLMAITHPEVLIQAIAERVAREEIRCTGCERDMPKSEAAGLPLFAGIVCDTCWKEHLEAVENERKSGHVCRFCRKAWLECCC